MSNIEEVADQALSILFLDLGYSLELPPRNGHHPIRHQVMWDMVVDALGDSIFVKKSKFLEKMRKDGEGDKQ